MSDELELAVQRGQLALDQGVKWGELLDAVFNTDVGEVHSEPFPAVGKHVEITPAFADAIMQLKEVWGSVEPKTRRALNEKEHAALYRERQVLKTIKDTLDARYNAINVIVKHHMDIRAEVEDRADPVATPRDTKGHYAIARRGQPERMDIPGSNEQWSREYRSNGAALSPDELLRMYEDEEISREDYLSFTRQARVVDEDKVMRAVVADPRRLRILYQIGQGKTPVVQLYVRKK